MFLTDWPLHLFPEVTLVTIYHRFFGKCRLNVDMTFPTVVTRAYNVAVVNLIFATDFSVHICFLLHAIISHLPLDFHTFHTSIPHILSINMSFTSSLFLKMAIIDKVLAIPCRGTVHLLLAKVQNF